jgi:CheY-like chemotaxis protein
MIAASIRSHLGGVVSFDWRTRGLVCTLELPVSCVGQARDSHIQTQASTHAAASAGDFGDSRVLLVEDEPLVGMMMAEILASIGLSVTGPTASLAGARALIDRCDFDLAVLDVNLGGELVYPLADTLADRGTALVFVTGYGPASIAAPYRSWPILQKPIESNLLNDAMRTALQHTNARRTIAGGT